MIGQRSAASRAIWLPEVGAQPQDGAWKAGASLITDHPHEVALAAPGLPDPTWRRCIVCGLGEAAHSSTIGAISF